MLHHKKRKYNNYYYKPKTLNLNEQEKENKTNIHHWNAYETILNSHGFNRSMLNVAYKHPDAVVGVDNRAYVAGTRNKRDIYDDITKIPSWNYDNIFSKSVGKIAENFSGKFVEGFLKETVFAPISIGAGEFVGRAVNQKTQEITKDVGNTKASQRYQDLDNYMSKNPNTDTIISHSLGTSASLEYGKDKPNINNITYGGPVLDLNSNQNTTRFRQKGDLISSFDFGANTIETTKPFDVLHNHSYSTDFDGQIQNTNLSDGSQILIN